MNKTPNFTGWHALVLHQDDSNTERLARQLGLLGIKTKLQWSPMASTNLPDLVFVDADQGWDELLPFSAVSPPLPVVALLGSEAPGRIAWAIRQGAAAVIAKPIASSAVYPALVMALSIHEERKAAASRIEFLEERVRLRPLVYAVIERLVAQRGMDEERAYQVLRECAMRRRIPLEQVAAHYLSGIDLLAEVG